MNSPKKIRIAVYLRVSTDEQAKKFGIDTQIRKLKQYIKFHEDEGWVLDDSFIYKDEGYSGTLHADGRPGLKKLMLDAKKKRFDMVVVYKLDRFFRSMRYLLDTIDTLQELDIGFFSVSEKFDTSPVGKLMLNIFGTLAQFERDLIIERTSEGKISAAKAGRYVGGAIPFGYDVFTDEKTKRKTIIPDKEESKLVREIYYWFTELGYTPLQIARALTKRRVLTNRDRKYNGKYRKANPMGKWSETTIRNKLKDEHYIGKYYYNRRDGSGKEKPKDQWVIMECPRIIDDETFAKAKRKLATLNAGGNYRKSNYLFSGKVICGLCSSAFTGYTSSKKTKNYRCLKTNKSKVVKVCRASNISENILSETLWPAIEHFLKHPKEAIAYLKKQMTDTSRYQFYKKQEKCIKDQLNKLKFRRQNVADMREHGQITSEDLDSRLELINRGKIALQDELEAIESQLTSQELEKEKIIAVKETLEKHKKNLKTLTYEKKCEIVKDVVKTIRIKGDEIEMTLYVPRKQQETPVKLKNVCGGTGGI